PDRTASVAFSADGKSFAMLVDASQSLRVYETATGKKLHQFDRDRKRGDDRWQYEPVLSPDGDRLAACSPSSVSVWDLGTKKLLHEVENCCGSLALSADGKYLACGDTHGIRLFQLDPFKELKRLGDRHDPIGRLAFSTDGSLLVAAQAHAFELWDVASGKQLNRIAGHYGAVRSLAISPDGAALASGGDDGNAIVWDMDARKLRHELAGHYDAVSSLAFA